MCVKNLSHMTKMADMPIYDENLYKSSGLELLDRFQRNLACSINDYCTTMCI